MPVLTLPVLLGYLFWPLQDPAFNIRWDQKMLEGKSEFLSTPVVHPADSAPNILLIVVDDLSLADIDLYTENAPVKTPQMNRLADEGVLFNNAYVTSPVCSPSRASIATGRYQQRFGYVFQMHDRYLRNRLEYYAFRYVVGDKKWQPQWQNAVPDAAAIAMQGLPPGEITIAELLKKQGYNTGLMGKWHMGAHDRNLPCALGFDEFWGFYESHSLYIPEGTPGYVDQKIDGDWTDSYIWEQQRNGPFGIFEQCNSIEEPDYLTFKIAEKSIDFMERNRESPFFLWASFNAPHTPLQAPQEYVNRFNHVQDPVKRVHYAMIAALDDAIGSVLDYLDQSGLSENTLIFLISDNGGAEYNLTTENGEYRGGKITQFEGGIKVPFIARFPGVIPAGKVYDTPVISPDIFATTAALSRAELPQDRIYDGRNLVAEIQANSPAKRNLYWQAGSNRSIRSGDWKLIWNYTAGDTSLFNLKEDPFEKQNLFEREKSRADRLFDAHQEWSAGLSEPLWPSIINYVYTDEDGNNYYFSN